MARQPVLDGERLVRAVGVHHEVDVQRCRNVGFNGAQELQELTAAMAAMEVSDDGPGGDVQCREQRGRADLPPTAVPTELRKSGVSRLIDLRGGR
jgi:hypothetical protein